MADSPIGLLGGIFDPVHHGHLAAAQLAADYFHLDKVYLVPAGLPPHKAATVSAPPEDRLAMLSLAVKETSSLAVWDEELRRPGPSYTVDTLRAVAEKYPKRPIYFVVGADNLAEIKTWRRYEEILSAAVLCVTDRPGYSLSIPPELATATIREFPSPRLGISSTLIRSYIARGYSCRYLAPDPVLEYIATRGLYRRPESSRV